MLASTEQPSSPLAPQTGGRNQRESSAHLSPQILIREAHKVLADFDFYMSPARVSRMVHRFVSEGRGDIDFRTWFISYADPTGETAVRNVMKQSGGPDAAA